MVEALFLRYLIIPLAPATTWASPSYIHTHINTIENTHTYIHTYKLSKPLPHTPRLTARFPTVAVAAAGAYSELDNIYKG